MLRARQSPDFSVTLRTIWIHFASLPFSLLLQLVSPDGVEGVFPVGTEPLTSMYSLTCWLFPPLPVPTASLFVNNDG